MISIKVVTILLTLMMKVRLGLTGAKPPPNCLNYHLFYNDAKTHINIRRLHERNLQEGYDLVMLENDVGYTEPFYNSFSLFAEFTGRNRKAETLTAVATLLRDKDIELSAVNLLFDKCLECTNVTLESHSQYRAINGYGNNLLNPNWGSASMPFSRSGPKVYDDGIHSIRRSLTGSDLPSTRLIVQEIMTQAEKSGPPSDHKNVFMGFLLLYLVFDMAFQVPVEAFKPDERIRCCFIENEKILAEEFLHSACLPISVGHEDSFYKSEHIHCLNMIRSQQATHPCSIQYGEILNKATSFIDHSQIYGLSDDEALSIRTYSQGKIRMDPKNVMPVGSNGNYLESNNRLTKTPLAMVWPSIFSRNHNMLAEGLAAANPQWNDQKLFNEARRINIAILQAIVIDGGVLHNAFGLDVDENYNDDKDASTSIEFTTIANRMGHAFVQPKLFIANDIQNVQKIPTSDTLNRVDLLEDNYEGILIGALLQNLNFHPYTDEIINKFAKNDKGMGLDVIAIDIQRGRDHGVASYLETRRKCELSADFHSFDDLEAILMPQHVDLLKEVYDDIEDIDALVGGTLETFGSLNSHLFGETLVCIFREQYRRAMAGDAYWYSHETNPYPFTEDQLTAIRDFSVSHLLCKNSNLESVQKLWHLVQTDSGEKDMCADLSSFNFQPFTE